MGIDARAFVPADYDRVRDLYRKVWNRERSDVYDRMRFLETMDGLPVAASAWSKHGDYAGFFTLWPLELSDGRRVVKAGEAMDVMTDSRFRGKGVFPRLADLAAHMAAERGMKLLFGAPNEAIFETYLKRLAWASPTFIRTFVRPLSLNGVIPLGWLAKPAFALWPKKREKSVEIREERLPPVALKDCLGSDRPKRGRWRLNRTPEWYDFRYRDAGKFDYRWISVWRDEKLAAFAVWGLSVEVEGRLRRANLADVIGVDVLARQTAVSAAATAAARAGANFLAATMTSRDRAREFQHNGFLPYSKSPLISKTLGSDSFDANPFSADGWDLFGSDFDFF